MQSTRWQIVGLCLALALFAGDVSRLDAADKPNLLLILVDDLGPEWISCYGGEELQTPHIDRLAAQGLRFENAYSMPQCTPSRVTLLTGQYPFRHGWVNHWDVPRFGGGCHFDPAHNFSFARELKAAGYATAAAGKWQINDFRIQPDIMRAHGFDEYCMWTGYETPNPPSAERYWNPYLHTSQGSRTYEGQFGEDVFTEFLIDFMRKHRDEPLLMYFPMTLTHTPFTTTPLDRDAQGRLAQHKAMVRYTDVVVGRLVAALEELKLREKTVIVFTTDNGSTHGLTAKRNGRPIRGGKATLGESGVQQPLIVSCPGRVPEGKVTDALADFSDIAPTFAELAGVTLPSDVTIDGHSLAPLLLGAADDSPREWILAMGFGNATRDEQGVRPVKKFADRVVRDKRFKLWVEDGRPSRLYDLQADLGEQRNLIDSQQADAAVARQKLSAVVQTFPAQDARPKYDPTPRQSWEDKSANQPPRKKQLRRAASRP